MTTLKPGDMAPQFEAPDQHGNLVSLDSMRGKRFVLYFYPKDNTSGCTIEAKNLRDGRQTLADMGLSIIGVSPDSVRSHEGFDCKHSLGFTLLSDTDKKIVEAYGVWGEKKMYGRSYMGVYRTTFVVDAQGCIERVITKVDTKNHWQQIVDELSK
ncbi:MAG: thioredoxin-dependent thiol peroxidase [Rikenellaceae bacterium]|nr:thioredoxin-dependent thiol peroxidase [Rikenellaceae bacterium]